MIIEMTEFGNIPFIIMILLVWEVQLTKPRGRPNTTYLQVIKTQFKEKHFQTLEDAMMEAKDREKWRAIVQDPSFFSG